MKRKTILIITILFGLAVFGALAYEIRVSGQQLTEESARQLLKQGFDLRNEGKYEEAITVLEKVVDFDPKLEVSFPDEGIQLLQATGELAMTYYVYGDCAKALPLFEQCDKDMREKYPNADLFSPSLIIECRRKLGIEGNADRDPDYHKSK